jgi:hypothetical protein
MKCGVYLIHADPTKPLCSCCGGQEIMATEKAKAEKAKIEAEQQIEILGGGGGGQGSIYGVTVTGNGGNGSTQYFPSESDAAPTFGRHRRWTHNQLHAANEKEKAIETWSKRNRQLKPLPGHEEHYKALAALDEQNTKVARTKQKRRTKLEIKLANLDQEIIQANKEIEHLDTDLWLFRRELPPRYIEPWWLRFLRWSVKILTPKEKERSDS